MMRKVTGLIAGLAMAVGLAAPAMASLSQGFATTQTIPSGSLVSLDSKASGNVVVADMTTADRLFGVSVPTSSASISLGSGTNGQVQVVTTGTATAFVSTAGGAIKSGDYIAISPIAGVGQKATARSRVIGTALANFDGSGADVVQRSIQTDKGNKEVAVGQVPIAINISTFVPSDSQQSAVPSWLQTFANSVAGKTVSPVRIILAGLILIVALISIAILLYSAVRNSIISIGRNPLSRTSVLKGLSQVIIISVVFLALASGMIYLVITK